MKLPTVDEAEVMAAKLLNTFMKSLSEKEQAFFIAGFVECIKWLQHKEEYMVES